MTNTVSQFLRSICLGSSHRNVQHVVPNRFFVHRTPHKSHQIIIFIQNFTIFRSDFEFRINFFPIIFLLLSFRSNLNVCRAKRNRTLDAHSPFVTFTALVVAVRIRASLSAFDIYKQTTNLYYSKSDFCSLCRIVQQWFDRHFVNNNTPQYRMRAEKSLFLFETHARDRMNRDLCVPTKD